MTKLPKRTKFQKIGVGAADLLSSVFAEFCNVVPVPQDRDFGVDFICEIMEGEYPTGKLFNVQCKGKEETKLGNGVISVSIKVSTLNYWLLHPNPTFLIVVDCQKNIFYWSFPQNFLMSLKQNWQEQKTVSIQIPTQNCFHQEIKTLPAQVSIYNESSKSFKYSV